MYTFYVFLSISLAIAYLVIEYSPYIICKVLYNTWSPLDLPPEVITHKIRDDHFTIVGTSILIAIPYVNLLVLGVVINRYYHTWKKHANSNHL
jgi:hypothetical protein